MTASNRVEQMHHGAAQYGQANGLPVPGVNFSKVVACPERGRQIASAYEAAPAYDPTAIPAYRAFVLETVRQFEFLTRPIAEGGLGVQVII